ncbi:exopolysaccharide biosynthesis polyprenyl glycosylphosphotransferase [Aquiflexum sp. TKW24L]|uniref:exopolysaccharide biosynthesis polyprenyl glycosylphosphotransferase n=1 Tax=Aquiflexum sp. TKW24L TaxID=2942212 RepID=UPI0020C0E125|nr:exopolysaccharide biosynthesis polyprenyl glycosylphosphotransferase [Aquiflexum sp. TKW24L]MCL6258662.1 exopolysaccharide biosynthesis polyprenyl glycosylphosphotransferase [Aquiflexum sp. TKW24L]
MTYIYKSNVPVSLFSDVLNLTFAFFISLNFYGVNDMYFQSMETLFLGLLISLWLFIGYSNKLYLDRSGTSYYKSWMKRYFKTYFILAGTIGIAYLIFSFPKDVRDFLTAILVSIPSLGIITNSLFIRFHTQIRDRKLKIGTTLIAGSGTLARKVAKTLESSSYGKSGIQGFIDCNSGSKGLLRRDGIVTDLDSLKEYLKDNYVDEIIIALPHNDLDNIKFIIKIADYHGARIRFVPDFKGIFSGNVKSYFYGDLLVVNLRQLPLDNWFPKLLKNIFDMLFAIIVLFCFVPILFIIGALIKLDSPGPIFYCPLRIGKGGKHFKIYKFRTMKICECPTNGTQSTVKNDPRITGVGKFLRKFSLDELPQFINVLTGEMSVVGPRPHRLYLNHIMQESEDTYMVRHYYKPGITGWAQVNGWRGPLETAMQKKQRTSHDLWYIKNWTFWLDIRIIWLTIFGKKTHMMAF